MDHHENGSLFNYLDEKTLDAVLMEDDAFYYFIGAVAGV